MSLQNIFSQWVASYRHYDTKALKKHLLDLMLQHSSMDEDSEEYALLSENIEIVREVLNRRYWGGKF